MHEVFTKYSIFRRFLKKYVCESQFHTGIQYQMRKNDAPMGTILCKQVIKRSDSERCELCLSTHIFQTDRHTGPVRVTV
jgi:hypothetical protein